ncbi:MAG: mechanosensitive ion channel family protein [Spirochaetia bacterium]|nr:mechanosensitive ion channel family protein [Spirochaetia bacterium]
MKEIFLTHIYWGNSLLSYMISLLIVVSGTVVLVLVGFIINRWVKTVELRNEQEIATESQLRSIAVLHFIQKIVLPLVFLALLSIGLTRLTFSDTVKTTVNSIFTAIITLVIIRSINKSIELSFIKYFSKESHVPLEKSIKPLMVLVKLIIWIVGFLFILSNLGYNITTAIAGLGVTGIAVAIAAQGILGDLFNYFVILFDKPFELGDFIVFDDKMGVVEKIGIKTTHIRTLQGEILVVTNTNLSVSRLHNYKKMNKRRVAFTVGVTYQTSEEHVKEIPVIIRHIIETVKTVAGVTCDRSHFKAFGTFSLDFESVYYIPSPEYPKYMDVQQEINRRIYAAFREKGIEFAYPTQTIFLDGDGEIPKGSI